MGSSHELNDLGGRLLNHLSALSLRDAGNCYNFSYSFIEIVLHYKTHFSTPRRFVTLIFIRSIRDIDELDYCIKCLSDLIIILVFIIIILRIK